MKNENKQKEKSFQPITEYFLEKTNQTLKLKYENEINLIIKSSSDEKLSSLVVKYKKSLEALNENIIDKKIAQQIKKLIHNTTFITLTMLITLKTLLFYKIDLPKNSFKIAIILSLIFGITSLAIRLYRLHKKTPDLKKNTDKVASQILQHLNKNKTKLKLQLLDLKIKQEQESQRTKEEIKQAYLENINSKTLKKFSESIKDSEFTIKTYEVFFA